MIIAIDFDGTIHDGEYPHIGEARKDAVTVLRKLHEDGHYLILWTCREGDDLDAALRWLESMGVHFDAVNRQRDGHSFEYEARKVYADIYIDDHNIVGLPSWNVIYKMIQYKQ